MIALVKTLKTAAMAPTTGLIVAGTTVSAGVVEVFNLIPDNIGKLAALLSAVLTVVVIKLQMRRTVLTRLEERKKELEIKLIEKQLRN